MPAVKVKIKSLPRFDLPRFTASEMRELGEAVKDAEVARIKRAEMPDGSPAKPLAVHTANSGKRFGYAIFKQKKVGRNKRDWYGTGRNPEHMLDVLTVATRRTANGMAAVVKFPASVIKRAMIRENTDNMFALSVHGRTKGNEIAAKYLVRAVARANRAAKRAGQ